MKLNACRLIVCAKIICIVMNVLCIFTLGLSFAQQPSKQSTSSIRVELLTDIPIAVGTNIIYEGPYRLRVSGMLGWMPSDFVTLSNSVVQQIEPSYSQETAELVENTIKDSLVMRLKAGWKPFKARGLIIQTGYTLVTLGGGTTLRTLIEGITGNMIEGGRERSRERVPTSVQATASLQMIDLGLGWEWALNDQAMIQQSGGIILRTEIGWSYTFTSNAQLQSDVPADRPRLRAAFDTLEDEGEQYLIETFEQYIHPPSFTIALGYIL